MTNPPSIPLSVTVTVPGAGHAVITRVPGADSADGIPHADVRLTVALPADDTAAALRLVALLTHVRALIGPARTDYPYDRPHRRAA
jgi:hypothetical protein